MNTPEKTPTGPNDLTPPSRSLKIHRRQSFWQIGVPLGVGVAVVLAFLGWAIFSASQGNPGVGQFSNISIMFLILPVAVAGLAFFVLFSGLVYLFARLLHILPKYTQLGQKYTFQFFAVVKSLADRAASPIMTVLSSLAGFKALVRRIF